MATTTLFDTQGKKSSKTQNLDDAIFAIEPNDHLIYLAKIRQEANARAGTAHTKTRPEVRGGGAKPWKQKGTGKARAGSSNSPLWRGGGVIFGPRNTVNWTKGMNKKESALALVSALALAQKEGRFAAIEELTVKEAKSKEIKAIIQTSGLCGKNVLFVIESENEQSHILERVARNVVKAKVITTQSLNVKDLLKADQIIASSKAIAEIEERFAPLKKVA